ncbi:NTP transferase domain-containing protein [Candidatus Saganbacteria bacterium]|nr:NTP transferase domain-containing protein [Candidatus Saganbacteria bacterium]
MKSKKAFVLAGGLGTRLRPLTFAIPKPLIPVRERPIIDYIITRLVKFGFTEIFVSLNYQAELIRHYLASKECKGIKITCFEEDSSLGTAGPLSFLRKKDIRLADDESVMVINGDILTDLDFGRFSKKHIKDGAAITVAMINYEYQLSLGVLELDPHDRIIGISEKPKFSYNVSAGIYLVKHSAIDLVPFNRYTMPELICNARKKGLLVNGYLIKEHWLAIEQIKQLEEASLVKKGDWISKL